MKKSLYILGLVLLGTSSAVAGQRPTTMPSQAAAPAIVRVVGRDTTIVARTGTNGPVYSLESKTGQILVPSMTLPELQAKHPDLAKQIRTTNASARDIGAWAGVE